MHFAFPGQPMALADRPLGDFVQAHSVAARTLPSTANLTKKYLEENDVLN